MYRCLSTEQSALLLIGELFTHDHPARKLFGSVETRELAIIIMELVPDSKEIKTIA